MGRQIIYWIFLGVIGFSTFILLRPSIDFNAGAPIEESRSTVERKTVELARQMGFSLDSLHMLSTRTQHLNYYRSLQDSLQQRLATPGMLNEQGVNLSGWKVTIGSKIDDQNLYLFKNEELFQEVGRIQLQYDNLGRVRRLRSNPDLSNPTFVAGDSLFSIANNIVQGILHYDLESYSLNYVDIKDTVMVPRVEEHLENSPLNQSNNSVGNNTVFSWKKNEIDIGEPAELVLEIKPVIKEVSGSGGAPIKYGATVERFEALDEGEPAELEGSLIFSNLTLIVYFISLGVLVCFVFYVGIKHINQGQVDWKRAISIMIVVALGIVAWRAIYLINTLDPFLNNSGNSIFLLDQLFLGGAIGLYAALAYIGWEATARSDNQPQVHLVDAFWRKRFFFRETGDGLLRGYALGGILLGLFAFLMYVTGEVYYQADSQFGFAEPSLQPKLLTINISAWTNVTLVALGHVGVVLGVLQSKFNKQWLLYLVGIVVTGLLFAGSANLIAINGPVWYDVLIFSLMAPVIIYAFNRSGLLTFFTGWWLFAVTMLITPYWGSSSMDVAYIAWVQLFIVAAPLIYGFVAYRYGRSVSEMGGYIPEYQERIANHLRVEKEIEIARESQFKLMPLQPPMLDGIDVYGFFMPSFEVGGDYFDYVVGKNGTAGPENLTMTIVDVSGKAMKAAMHAVFTSGLLLSRLHRDQPDAILREVAPTLHTRTDPQTFITCIITSYNLQTRKLTIANAGHCLPILKRSGQAEFIRTPAPKYPLGLMAEVPYQALDVTLEPGDFLLLYSDGLPEAVNPEGNRFGFDTMLEMVTTMKTDSMTSNEIALDIKRRIQKFSDYQLADDTTIICLKV